MLNDLIHSSLLTLGIVLLKDDKTGHEDPRTQPALSRSRWFGLLDFRKTEALADSLLNNPFY